MSSRHGTKERGIKTSEGASEESQGSCGKCRISSVIAVAAASRTLLPPDDPYQWPGKRRKGHLID